MTNSLCAVDFNRLLERFIAAEIALSREDISSAVKSREWFLRQLKNKIDSKVGEPKLFSEEPFVYFGSHFKGTQAVDVDEYDVLVVIDSNTGEFKQHGVKVGNGLGSATPNHKYDDGFKKEDLSGVSPAKLLNWLKGITEEVVETFNGTAPERNGQAITVRIESKDLKIDLVPCGKFKHSQREGVVFYDIPKGDKDNGWILTDPRQDIKLLDDCSVKRENFKNTIRLIKFIKNRYNFLIPSFAIECVAIDYIQTHAWENKFFTDFMHVLAHFHSCLKVGKINDTFDASINLIADVESKEWYAERVLNIYQTMLKQMEENDEEKIYRNICKALKNQL